MEEEEDRLLFEVHVSPFFSDLPPKEDEEGDEYEYGDGYNYQDEKESLQSRHKSASGWTQFTQMLGLSSSLSSRVKMANVEPIWIYRQTKWQLALAPDLCKLVVVQARLLTIHSYVKGFSERSLELPRHFCSNTQSRQIAWCPRSRYILLLGSPDSNNQKLLILDTVKGEVLGALETSVFFESESGVASAELGSHVFCIETSNGTDDGQFLCEFCLVSENGSIVICSCNLHDEFDSKEGAQRLSCKILASIDAFEKPKSKNKFEVVDSVHWLPIRKEIIVVTSSPTALDILFVELKTKGSTEEPYIELHCSRKMPVMHTPGDNREQMVRCMSVCSNSIENLVLLLMNNGEALLIEKNAEAATCKKVEQIRDSIERSLRDENWDPKTSNRKLTAIHFLEESSIFVVFDDGLVCAGQLSRSIKENAANSVNNASWVFETCEMDPSPPLLGLCGSHAIALNQKCNSLPSGYEGILSRVAVLRVVDSWSYQVFTMTHVTGVRAVQKKTRDGCFDEALALVSRLNLGSRERDKVLVAKWILLYQTFLRKKSNISVKIVTDAWGRIESSGVRLEGLLNAAGLIGQEVEKCSTQSLSVVLSSYVSLLLSGLERASYADVVPQLYGDVENVLKMVTVYEYLHQSEGSSHHSDFELDRILCGNFREYAQLISFSGAEDIQTESLIEFLMMSYKSASIDFVVSWLAATGRVEAVQVALGCFPERFLQDVQTYLKRVLSHFPVGMDPACFETLLPCIAGASEDESHGRLKSLKNGEVLLSQCYENENTPSDLSKRIRQLKSWRKVKPTDKHESHCNSEESNAIILNWYFDRLKTLEQFGQTHHSAYFATAMVNVLDICPNALKGHFPLDPISSTLSHYKAVFEELASQLRQFSNLLQGYSCRTGDGEEAVLQLLPVTTTYEGWASQTISNRVSTLMRNFMKELYSNDEITDKTDCFLSFVRNVILNLLFGPCKLFGFMYHTSDGIPTCLRRFFAMLEIMRKDTSENASSLSAIESFARETPIDAKIEMIFGYPELEGFNTKVHLGDMPPPGLEEAVLLNGFVAALSMPSKEGKACALQCILSICKQSRSHVPLDSRIIRDSGVLAYLILLACFCYDEMDADGLACMWEMLETVPEGLANSDLQSSLPMEFCQKVKQRLDVFRAALSVGEVLNSYPFMQSNEKDTSLSLSILAPRSAKDRIRRRKFCRYLLRGTGNLTFNLNCLFDEDDKSEVSRSQQTSLEHALLLHCCATFVASTPSRCGLDGSPQVPQRTVRASTLLHLVSKIRSSSQAAVDSSPTSMESLAQGWLKFCDDLLALKNFFSRLGQVQPVSADGVELDCISFVRMDWLACVVFNCIMQAALSRPRSDYKTCAEMLLFSKLCNELLSHSDTVIGTKDQSSVSALSMLLSKEFCLKRCDVLKGLLARIRASFNASSSCTMAFERCGDNDEMRAVLHDPYLLESSYLTEISIQFFESQSEACSSEAEFRQEQRLLDMAGFLHHLDSLFNHRYAADEQDDGASGFDLDFVPVQLRLLGPLDIAEKILRICPRAYRTCYPDGAESLGSPSDMFSEDMCIFPVERDDEVDCVSNSSDVTDNSVLLEQCRRSQSTLGLSFAKLCLGLPSSSRTMTQQRLEVLIYAKAIRAAISVEEYDDALELAEVVLKRLAKLTIPMNEPSPSALQTDVTPIIDSLTTILSKAPTPLTQRVRSVLMCHAPDTLIGHVCESLRVGPCDRSDEMHAYLAQASLTEIFTRLHAEQSHSPAVMTYDSQCCSFSELKPVDCLLTELNSPIETMRAGGDLPSSSLPAGIALDVVINLLMMRDESIAKQIVSEVKSCLKDRMASFPSDAILKRPEAALPTVEPLESLVCQIEQMGFSKNGARRAVMHTNNSSMEEALRWAIEHSTEKDFDEPVVTQRTSGGKACLLSALEAPPDRIQLHSYSQIFSSAIRDGVLESNQLDLESAILRLDFRQVDFAFRIVNAISSAFYQVKRIPDQPDSGEATVKGGEDAAVNLSDREKPLSMDPPVKDEEELYRISDSSSEDTQYICDFGSSDESCKEEEAAQEEDQHPTSESLSKEDLTSSDHQEYSEIEPPAKESREVSRAPIASLSSTTEEVSAALRAAVLATRDTGASSKSFGSVDLASCVDPEQLSRRVVWSLHEEDPSSTSKSSSHATESAISHVSSEESLAGDAADAVLQLVLALAMHANPECFNDHLSALLPLLPDELCRRVEQSVDEIVSGDYRNTDKWADHYIPTATIHDFLKRLSAEVFKLPDSRIDKLGGEGLDEVSLYCGDVLHKLALIRFGAIMHDVMQAPLGAKKTVSSDATDSATHYFRALAKHPLSALKLLRAAYRLVPDASRWKGFGDVIDDSSTCGNNGVSVEYLKRLLIDLLSREFQEGVQVTPQDTPEILSTMKKLNEDIAVLRRLARIPHGVAEHVNLKLLMQSGDLLPSSMVDSTEEEQSMQRTRAVAEAALYMTADTAVHWHRALGRYLDVDNADLCFLCMITDLFKLRKQLYEMDNDGSETELEWPQSSLLKEFVRRNEALFTKVLPWQMQLFVLLIASNLIPSSLMTLDASQSKIIKLLHNLLQKCPASVTEHLRRMDSEVIRSTKLATLALDAESYALFPVVLKFPPPVVDQLLEFLSEVPNATPAGSKTKHASDMHPELLSVFSWVELLRSYCFVWGLTWVLLEHSSEDQVEIVDDCSRGLYSAEARQQLVIRACLLSGDEEKGSEMRIHYFESLVDQLQSYEAVLIRVDPDNTEMDINSVISTVAKTLVTALMNASVSLPPTHFQRGKDLMESLEACSPSKDPLMRNTLHLLAKLKHLCSFGPDECKWQRWSDATSTMLACMTTFPHGESALASSMEFFLLAKIAKAIKCFDTNANPSLGECPYEVKQVYSYCLLNAYLSTANTLSALGLEMEAVTPCLKWDQLHGGDHCIKEFILRVIGETMRHCHGSSSVMPVKSRIRELLMLLRAFGLSATGGSLNNLCQVWSPVTFSRFTKDRNVVSAEVTSPFKEFANTCWSRLLRGLSDLAKFAKANEEEADDSLSCQSETDSWGVSMLYLEVLLFDYWQASPAVARHSEDSPLLCLLTSHESPESDQSLSINFCPLDDDLTYASATLSKPIGILVRLVSTCLECSRDGGDASSMLADVQDVVEVWRGTEGDQRVNDLFVFVLLLTGVPCRFLCQPIAQQESSCYQLVCETSLAWFHMRLQRAVHEGDLSGEDSSAAAFEGGLEGSLTSLRSDSDINSGSKALRIHLPYFLSPVRLVVELACSPALTGPAAHLLYSLLCLPAAMFTERLARAQLKRHLSSSLLPFSVSCLEEAREDCPELACLGWGVYKNQCSQCTDAH